MEVKFIHLVLCLMFFALIPLSIIHAIQYLDAYVDEVYRKGEYTSDEAVGWVIFYYVIGLTNLLYFPIKGIKFKYFLCWIIGLELIGLGAVSLSFYDHLNYSGGGWVVFPWDFAIPIFSLGAGALYSFICFVAALSSSKPTKTRQ
ncbi:hypothetical protein [Paenibacillus macerans]|uniref:hypothetical protein n=1 Tax=Paenibacillus macerans TaxID=44252 RepID=UPI003D3176CA